MKETCRNFICTYVLDMGVQSFHNQYRLDYCQYRRPFNRPIMTAAGKWTTRDGLIIRIEDVETGHLGFGEVAPLVAFGSESLETARGILGDLGNHPAEKDLELAISEAPVATAFGIATALADNSSPASVRTAALIPNVDADRDLIERLTQQGFSTFKVKLGIREPEAEWAALERLVTSLNKDQLLRLDPNGSWGSANWRFWKSRLVEVASSIEFLEEPFPRETPTEYWLEQAGSSPVALALDESLANGTLVDWCKLGWPGYWIIKPSLYGKPENWLSPLSKYRRKVVLSSTFETGIGMSVLVRLATQFPGTDHGMGIQSYFEDALCIPASGALVTSLDASGLEAIWNQLSGA